MHPSLERKKRAAEAMLSPPSRRTTIYAWLSRIGAPVYVGKTSSPLAAGVTAQIAAAKAGKSSRKFVWLRCQEQPVRTVVLQMVDPDRASIVKRRWVSRLRRRFELMNEADAGGGPHRHRQVEFDQEASAFLGVIADSKIARDLGVDRKTVAYHRTALGIPASNDRSSSKPPPSMGGWNRKELSSEIIALLGTMSDQALSLRAGVSKKKITRERNFRGIASYAASTGNDGRIRPGERGGRWKNR